jgi:DNA replication protein DnaC
LANPYLGLRSFTYDDRASFAGREKLIEDALEKIANPTQRQTLTFITGASGSGKSSFAQARLIPALEVYYHERHKTARRGRFQPGSDPLAMLADGISQLGLREPATSDLGRFTAAEFREYLETNTSTDEVNLLVIDQFEELFTTADARNRSIRRVIHYC